MYVSRELKALEELGYSQNDMLLVSSDVSYLLHPLKNASVFSIDSVWSWSLEADKMLVASLKSKGCTVRMGRMVE